MDDWLASLNLITELCYDASIPVEKLTFCFLIFTYKVEQHFINNTKHLKSCVHAQV